MKIILQSVKNASVVIDSQEKVEIGEGFLIYVGFTHGDNEQVIDKMVYKISGLRIFEDENEKMNLSIKDINGEMLIISNFTLYADMSHGFRPSFTKALPQNDAKILYESFVNKMKANFNEKIKTGKFQSTMEVSSLNFGPKTFDYEILN